MHVSFYTTDQSGLVFYMLLRNSHMDITAENLEGLLLAALLGAVIGLDREYRGKAAGFRTLILVSMGSALFSMVSYRMALLDPEKSSDVTRIASNIVTGVGFLCAGIIFRTGKEVIGLTTSATVWIVAAIGMAAGIGSFALATIATLITWMTLFLLHYIENMVLDLVSTEKYLLRWHTDHGSEIQPKDFFDHWSFQIRSAKLNKSNDLVIAEWTIRASKKAHEAAVENMLKDRRIAGLEY
ncbi:MAG: MgtC/SapB family protein [Sphingobacteriales bacterium]|nr:MAG: MgtC/SapB family protein [Sphingobacteriales bacterium]